MRWPSRLVDRGRVLPGISTIPRPACSQTRAGSPPSANDLCGEMGARVIDGGRRGFARRPPNDRSCEPIGGPARTLAFRYLDQRRCKLGFLVFNHAPVRPLTQREPRGFETTP